MITTCYPIIGGGLLASQLNSRDPLWDRAAVAAEHILRITGEDPQGLRSAKMHSSLPPLTRPAVGQIYEDRPLCNAPSVGDIRAVRGPKTDGRIPRRTRTQLRNVAEPHRMLQFFGDEFLTALPAGSHLIEIGPGHGLFASVLLSSRPDVRYTGIDISPSSLTYSTSSFNAAKIDRDRYNLHLGDASLVLDTFGGGNEPFGAAVCCEVLEHVDDPGSILNGLRNQVRAGASVFLSTVCNMEAEDHIYLFKDVDEVRECLRAAGFDVIDDRPLILPGADDWDPQPINYSAIVRPRASAASASPRRSRR